MLKHITHFACNRDCSYCITKNVRMKPSTNFIDLDTKYREMYEAGHKTIMLTGGEPVIYKHFSQILSIAHNVFDEVYLTTQHETALAAGFPQHLIKATTFSIHDAHIPDIYRGGTIYASIVDVNWEDWMFKELANKGYDGLTLNEEQFAGDPRLDEEFYEKLEALCYTAGMSFRVNRLGHCMDETIILPDLRVVTDFREFM